MAKRRNFFIGFQSEGGAGGDPRRRDGGGAVGALPGSPEHDWEVEAVGDGGLKSTFERGGAPADRGHEEEVKRLQAKIGELVIERDFLAKAFDR